MQSSRTLLSFACLAAAVLQSGCAVGPKYSAPTVPVPVAYKETDGWKTAEPSDHQTKGPWWEVFGDSQLNALQEKAAQSNQNVQLAEAQFRQARALVRVNRSSLFPGVTAQPAITDTRPSANAGLSRTLTGARSGSIPDYNLPLDVSWEADVWGRIRKTVQSSIASAQASAADLENARLSLHSELATDYFTLRALESEKRLLSDTIDAYDKTLELTKARFENGVASKADVAQAQTQLETARAQATDLDVQRTQMEHAIAVLTGVPPSELSIPESDAPPMTPFATPPGLPSRLLERRPDIASAERKIAAANAQVGLARTAWFPILTLTGSTGFDSQSLGTWLSWPSRLWSIGPAAAATLFDGGRRRATLDQARAGYDAAVAEYRQTVLQGFQDVEDNVAALRVLETEASQQQAAVRAAEDSLAISVERYKSGVAAYLDVLTAQTAVLTNQRAAIDIERRRMLASVQLIKALGGGWDTTHLPAPEGIKH
jgi:NodT family efflux transporter outer membrane factor (OMF) lipoprotein